MNLKVENLKNLEIGDKKYEYYEFNEKRKTVQRLLGQNHGSSACCCRQQHGSDGVSIFGVGLLALFNQVIGTYHQQTVESSPFLVTSETEMLFHKNLRPAYEGWAKAGLTLSDLARSKVTADAWHWGFTDRQLNFLGASGSSRVQLTESGIPFMQIAAGNFAVNFQSEAMVLP